MKLTYNFILKKFLILQFYYKITTFSHTTTLFLENCNLFLIMLRFYCHKLKLSF